MGRYSVNDIYTNTEVDYMYNDDESYNTFHGNIKGPKKGCGNCIDCKCKPKKEPKTEWIDFIYNDDDGYCTFLGNTKGPKKCGNCTDCKCKPKREPKTNEQDLLSRLKVIQALVNSAVEELRK